MMKSEQYLKGTVQGTSQNILNNETIDRDKFYVVEDLPNNSGISNLMMHNILSNPVLNNFLNINDVVICIDEGTYKKGGIYKFLGTSWEELAAIPEIDLSNYYTKSQIDDLLPKAIIVED